VFWDKFTLRQSEIKNVINTNTGYGVSFDSNYTNYNYLEAFEVSKLEDIPKGMVYKEIPQCKYAVFTLNHKLIIENFYKTIDYIFKSWLKNSHYKLYNNITLIEMIFDPSNKRELFDLYIPIK